MSVRALATMTFTFAAITFAALTFAAPLAAQAPPAALVHATQGGTPAFDGDPSGGNPFATAFIQALGEGPGDDRATLTERTLANSGGGQRPDLAGAPATLDLRPNGKAVALVIVFADYGDDQGLASLPGAAFDAARVSAALKRAGYAASLAIVGSRAEYLDRLAAFTRQSAGADEALLYTTGHGMEAGGNVWLIPPEFDPADRSNALEPRAIRVAALGGKLGAKQRNQVFYAGCRDNPLGF